MVRMLTKNGSTPIIRRVFTDFVNVFHMPWYTLVLRPGPSLQVHSVRSFLSVLQDGGHAEEHGVVLRAGAARGRVDGPGRHQDHLERHQGDDVADHVPAVIHEVQGW